MSSDAPRSSTLDPAAVWKQMAALSAAQQARQSQSAAHGSGYVNGLFSGDLPMTSNSPYVYSQAQPQVASYKAKQLNFLTNLGQFMNSRNTPLPAEITTVPYPDGHNPANSPWKTLMPCAEPGNIRLADGLELDLFKLWMTVMQLGGGAVVQRSNTWPSVVTHCQLPQELPTHNGNSNATAAVVAHLYNAILTPFEEIYRQTMNRPKASSDGSMDQLNMPLGAASSYPIQSGLMSPSLSSNTPGLPSLSSIPTSSGLPDTSTSSSAHADNGFDLSAGVKRPRESEGDESQRAIRQRTGVEAQSHTFSAVNGALPTSGRQPSARRKIEYVPLSREMTTHGGRDLSSLGVELARAPQGRTKRHSDEWGTVDVEALTMSLRSRIPTELSYALTAFAFMTLLQSSTPGSGFPLHTSPNFFDEILDLLHEAAFNGAEEVEDDTTGSDPPELISHCDLVRAVQDDGTTLFVRVDSARHSKTSAWFVKQRPGDVIITIVNILRNLSNYTDNHGFLAQHPSFLPSILRLCDIAIGEDGNPRPASPGLSLSDLLVVRKDVLCIMCNIAGVVRLAHADVTPSILRLSRRVFGLVASFLLDASESRSPTDWIIQTGGPINTSVQPPPAADMALDVFTKVSHPDVNRQILATATSTDWIWALLQALVHRLPAVESDFVLGTHSEPWVSYTEKTVFSIYSIVFLASPDLKQRMKADWALCLPKVLYRLARKLMVHQNNDYRNTYSVCARRVVETLKLLDEGADSFDMTQSSMPSLAFGMGYGEASETLAEKGMGLFAGYREEVTWGLMIQREVDAHLFSELESLARIKTGISK